MVLRHPRKRRRDQKICDGFVEETEQKLKRNWRPEKTQLISLLRIKTNNKKKRTRNKITVHCEYTVYDTFYIFLFSFILQRSRNVCIFKILKYNDNIFSSQYLVWGCALMLFRKLTVTIYNKSY